MSEALKLLAKRLEAATRERGAKAAFCRATGMSASQVDGYIAGRNQPNLAVLERIAQHFGIAPWELIRPPGAEATPAPAPMADQAAIALIRELAATLTPARIRLLKASAALNNAEVVRAARNLELQGGATPDASDDLPGASGDDSKEPMESG